MTNDQTLMKNHFCPVEKEWIGYKGECNWCGEKETQQERPQNCGTGYCSCIEFVMDKEKNK
jgi:hypothetical protein